MHFSTFFLFSIFLNFCFSQTQLQNGIQYIGTIEPSTIQQFSFEIPEDGYAINIKFAGAPDIENSQFLQFNPVMRIKLFTSIASSSLSSYLTNLEEGIFTEGSPCPSTVFAGTYIIDVSTLSNQTQTFYVEASWRPSSLNVQQVLSGIACCGSSQTQSGEYFVYNITDLSSLTIIVNINSESPLIGGSLIMYARYGSCPSAEPNSIISDYTLSLTPGASRSITINSRSVPRLRNDVLYIALQRAAHGTETPPDLTTTEYQIVVCPNDNCPDYEPIINGSSLLFFNIFLVLFAIVVVF